MRRWALLLLPLLLLGTAAVHGEDPDTAARWAAAKSQAVRRLEMLARMAHRERLLAVRDRIDEEILLADPDHEEGRTRLGYRKQDGEWERAKGWRPGRDRGSEEAARRLQSALEAHDAWWRDQILTLAPAAREAKDGPTLRGILAVASASWPEDADVRALAGQVRYEGGEKPVWVLEDTAMGLANRARYLAAARAAARAVAPPRPGQIESFDRHGSFDWPRVLQGETTRVLGTVPEEELRRHHEIAEAASGVFRAVFGTCPSLPPVTGSYGRGYPIYVASSKKEGNAFLAAEPGGTERTMAFLRPLVAAHLQKRQGLVVKGDAEATRYEATSAMVLGVYRAFALKQYITGHGAWASEGLSFYLRWLQVRTRSIGLVVDETSRYGRSQPGVPTWEGRVADQGADWHALAAAAIRDLGLRDLHGMAGRNANTLTTKEMLAGYGLSAYVVEAHPEVATAFFTDVSEQQEVDLDAIFEKHLGGPLDAVLPHILQWLDEMAKAAPPPGPTR